MSTWLEQATPAPAAFPKTSYLPDWSDDHANRYALQCVPHEHWRGMSLRDWSVGAVRTVEVRLGSCTITNRRSAPTEASPLLLKLVLQGAVDIEQRGERATLGAGAIVMVDPDADFSETFTQPTHLAVFWLPRDLLRERSLSSRLFHLVLPPMGAAHNMALRAQLLSIVHHSPRGGAGLRGRMEQHLLDMMELVAQPQRARAYPAHVLRAAKAYIARHLGDPKLDAEAIGQAMGLTSNYLNRLFRCEGVTMMRWLWSQRLQVAARLLSDGDQRGLSVSEIAYRSGFSDAAHFSRRFRGSYGTTPREFRAARVHLSDK